MSIHLRKKLRCCIDSTEMGIKLDSDDDELKHRLGELKDVLISEFSLPQVSSTKWERHRNAFIKSINEITGQYEEAAKSNDLELKADRLSPEVHLPEEDLGRFVEAAALKWGEVDARSNPVIRGQSLSCDAMILLAYASEDGEIMVLTDLSGTSVEAGKWNFVGSQNRREVARWEYAVEELLRANFIKRVGRKDKIYNLTFDGHKAADAVIEQNKISFEKSPDEYLKD